MKKYRIRQWLALCLTLILTLTSLPLVVVAETVAPIVETETIETYIENNAPTEVEIVTDYFEEIDEQEASPYGSITEIVSLREENVKHFQLPNGTVEAVVYGEPVHRKDADGIWQDIDNNLAMRGNSTTIYETTDMRTAFAKDKPTWTINENGYTISMAYVSPSRMISSTSAIPLDQVEQLGHATIQNAPTHDKVMKWDTVEEARTLKKNVSTVTYANVQENVDIEYILQGNDIKENIIIKSVTGDYTYRFTLKLSGLVATLNNNGSISIIDQKTKQEKYVIPAPYMYDANGTMSYAVNYTLTAEGNDTYTLAVVADAEWIENKSRVFPIVVDPSVGNSSIIQDTYVNSAYPTENYGDSTELWVSPTRTTYIKTNLPYIPEGANITTAWLNIWYYYYVSSGFLNASMYQILDDWNEDKMTYNTRPETDSTLISRTVLSASPNITETSPQNTRFVITELVRSWYNETAENYGVAIKRESEYNDSGTNSSVILKSREAGNSFSPCLVVNYVYYIPDGVYALQNMGNQGRWMDIQYDSVNAGAYVQQYGFGTSPSTSFSRSGLYKISRVPNTQRYIVRLMLNNRLTIGISGTKVVTKEIPVADSEVVTADTFYIISDSQGFVLQPVGQTQVITANDTMASGSSGAPDSYLTTTSWGERTDEARWTLEKYTGVHSYGYILYRPVTLYAGDIISLSAVVWSTKIDYNTPCISVASGYHDYAVGSWNDGTFKGSYSLKTNGDFQIAIRIYNGSRQLSDIFYRMLTIELVVDEGTYFIKNKQHGVYMQIDDNDAPNYDSSGGIMELWDFDGGDYQKWRLNHIGNGYYTISSAKSHLSLAVQSSYLNTGDKPIVQEPLTAQERHQWKITKSSSGAYIIRPKSGESYETDWCMCAGGQFLDVTDGLNVEQRAYVNNNSYKDEWILQSINCSLPTPLIGQETPMWCWAASAEMLARTKHPTAANSGDPNTIAQEQRDAVYHVLGDDTSTSSTYNWNTDSQGLKSKGGIYSDVAQAAAFLVGAVNGDETFSGYATPYSEVDLIHFLLDGHAVARLYGWASITWTPPTTLDELITALENLNPNAGGHVTVIVGVKWSSVEQCYIYTVNDPWEGGSQLQYTYEELLSNVVYCGGEYEVSFWFPTVVTKTDYSGKTLIENIIGNDYSSN